jgi:aromatic-L-amino-acid/L-tryptophan decarboxylase
MEAHQSVSKAMDILGLGQEFLRKIPVNECFQIELGALRAAIAEDRTSGFAPFCVVGTIGTVNTGAIDNLRELAAVCREEDLWFHIDGAFGALAVLSNELRSRVDGIELADSLAFDFHKWMHVQYDAGCILVRNGQKHRNAFSMRAPYLHGAARGLAGGGEWPCDLGPELSRGFRALKVWFALKEHGTERLGSAISMNCRQAAYLAECVKLTPNLELLSTPSLNIVCFRFHPGSWSGASLDELNQNIIVELQLSGIAVPSAAWIKGVLAIRVNITNHRSRYEDFDLLVNSVLEIGLKITGSSGS